MKILYHHRTLGDGAEGVHVAAMVEAFRQLGHEVKMAAIIGEKTNVATSRVRALASLIRWIPRSAYELMELSYSLAGYRMLASHFKGWKPNILYERYTLFNIAGVIAARRNKVPLVLEVNAPLAYERAVYEGLALQRAARQCERFVCSHADLVIVVSTPLKDYLTELGISPERIVVLPNGVDPERFQPDVEARREIRAWLGIPVEAVVVGFAGILRPWHGVELLIEALARLTEDRENIHVLIVGDGPSRPSLQKLAVMRGVQKQLTITGRVLHEDIPRYLNACDIGVSLRATFYASPMKVLEYMATGLAVIAPQMSNLQDLIENRVNGLLFHPEDIDDLTTVLSSLVQKPKWRQQLGQRARAEILANRTWCQNARRVLQSIEH